MNNLKLLWFNVLYKIDRIKHYFEINKCKKLYPDFVDDDFNCGSLKHIWGVKSWDDLSSSDCNLYTMNDIDITYDRDTKEYLLGIETAYEFGEGKKGECKYLKGLLNAFTKFMNDNSYNTNAEYSLFCCNTYINESASSIEELYTNFRIFVEGFCKLYE